MHVAIEARGLGKSFGTVRAVDGLDLSIESGRIYGFLGPNGSGKSTTLRMLCGLLRPSAGEIRVLDYAIPAQSEALRRRMGYMTQSFSLYGDLSVAENLRFMATIYGLSGSVRRARIADLLQDLDLDALARQRAATLSGGQRQRLALAAATLHRPGLLLLDEPTSAVDPQSRRNFWEILFALSGEGTTILVSTHYMDEAERCHGLAILDAGRLAAEGSPRSLKADIGAAVIEVLADDPQAARRALVDLEQLDSMTRLGAAIRLLLDADADTALRAVRAALAGASVSARVTPTEASLEDVFVVATRKTKAA